MQTLVARNLYRRFLAQFARVLVPVAVCLNLVNSYRFEIANNADSDCRLLDLYPMHSARHTGINNTGCY